VVDHDGALSRPSTISEEAINRILHIDINHPLAEPPTIQETLNTIELLSSGKDPGADSISTAVYKVVGPGLVGKLTELSCAMWRRKCIHQDFTDALIVQLCKHAINTEECHCSQLHG
jgi:hypothetical protein